MLRHLAVALALAALLAAVACAPAGAAPTYLALGDSVTFGYEEPQVVPAPNYPDASSFVAYPQLVGQVLGLRIVNAACPGETTASLIDASAPSNGCENAYRRAYPLHVRYRGSQLGFAVRYLRAHPDVGAVSLMIGANDVFRCQRLTSDGCLSELGATLGAIGRNVRRIVSTLRGRGRYQGRIVVVAYYSTDYAGGVRQIVQALNRTVVDAARPYRIVRARGFAAWQGAARTSAGSSCVAGLLTQLGGPGRCGVHPTRAGQALLALAVADALTS